MVVIVADKKKPRRIKKVETVRERTERTKTEPKKDKKVRRVVSKAGKPIGKVVKGGRKEYHLIKLPDNKLGRILGRRVHFIPKFLRNSWAEVKQVSWPNAGETTKLTIAVVVFALALGGLVYGLDYGLEKLFREVLLG